ncbi:MAG: SAF domain-containing protein [Myxococcota bacterium]|nr:SAF domain-containing protein [Myxococcota bacterium]
MTTHARTRTGETASALNGGSPPLATPSSPAVSPSLRSSAAPVRSAAAGRRTSRRGVIISVLVVLVGGLIAFAGAQVLTRHTQVLAVTTNVPVGAVVTASDLTVASVTTDPNVSPIPASERSQIVGMVAQVSLVKGELLTRAQVGRSSGFTAGQVLVALPLKQGQYPARGLSAGQKVLIVATPGANGTTSASATSGSTTGASGADSAPPAGIDGTVADVGTMDQATEVTVIDVQVTADSGVPVAKLASTGNLALVLLPSGG